MIKQKLFRFKYLLILFILGLAFTGAECDKLLTGAGGIEGTWELVKMEGDLQDVCLGEIAQFSGTTATLQCPGQNSVTKAFTFTNNVLTYTASGIKYNVTFKSQNGIEKMVLTAQSVNRTLTYDRKN